MERHVKVHGEVGVYFSVFIELNKRNYSHSNTSKGKPQMKFLELSLVAWYSLSLSYIQSRRSNTNRPGGAHCCLLLFVTFYFSVRFNNGVFDTAIPKTLLGIREGEKSDWTGLSVISTPAISVLAPAILLLWHLVRHSLGLEFYRKPAALRSLLNP